MTNITLFIDPTYLKENSNFDINLEDRKIYSSIQNAQRTMLWPVLGTVLYEKLLTDIENNTLAGNYITLTTTYIIPTLNLFSQIECLNSLILKFSNKGIIRTVGENEQSSTLEEIKFVLNNVTDNAEFEKERLIKYLHANESLFPEYLRVTDNDDIPSDSSNYAFSGLYLGNGSRCCSAKERDETIPL